MWNYLEKHPKQAKQIGYLLLLISAALTVFGGYSLRLLSSQYSMQQFMPADHPLYKNDLEISKKFRISEEQPVLVSIELTSKAKGDWLMPERLEKVKQAMTTMEGVKGIQEVTSIVNFPSAIDTKDGIQVGKLLDLLPKEQWHKRLQEDTLLSPGLISADGRVLNLIGEIKYLSNEELDSMVEILRDEVGKLFKGAEYRVYVSGVAPLQSDLTVLVSKELRHFLIFAFIACLITLMAYFKNFSSVFVCLVLVVISNIGALAWMALAGLSFSILSTSLPILASITALAIGSHTLLNFSSNWNAETRGDKSKLTVVLETYRSLVLPNFLMCLTTAIGFATLAKSNVPLVREFSWSVCGGILISCFMISLTLAPLLLFFPIPVARKWTGMNAFWIHTILKFRFPILAFTVLSVALVTFKGMPLNWSVQMYDDLPNIGTVKQSAQLIDDKLGGMIPLEVMITEKGTEDPWNDPLKVQKLTDISNRFRKNPAVGMIIAIPDFLKSGFDNKALTRQSIAELLFLYSLSGPNNATSHFISTNNMSTRMLVMLKDVPSKQMETLISEVQKDVQAEFPQAEVKTGGMATLAHPLNTELSKSLISGLWESLFWISVLMVVFFRSVRITIIAAVPNLLAPLALLATMSFLQTPIKPVVGVIFSIALGIAYNNTVYLITRLRQVKNNVRKAWLLEGNPCLFSSLALFGGFGVFLSSYFELNRTFGAYMLWSIGAGLIGDLIFLPVLLSIFPWLSKESFLFSRLIRAIRARWTEYRKKEGKVTV